MALNIGDVYFCNNTQSYYQVTGNHQSTNIGKKPANANKQSNPNWKAFNENEIQDPSGLPPVVSHANKQSNSDSEVSNKNEIQDPSGLPPVVPQLPTQSKVGVTQLPTHSNVGGTPFMMEYGPIQFDTHAFDNEVNAASKKYGVDPYLVKAIIAKESNFDPNTPDTGSGAGACVGLMQLDETHHEGKDLHNPVDGIDLGTKRFAGLLERYPDPFVALEHYNGGDDRDFTQPNTNNPHGETPEHYAKIVLGYLAQFKSEV